MTSGNPVSKNFKPVVLDHLTVLIPEPDAVPVRPFVGREQDLARCQAAWLDVEGEGALHFRLIGPPGVGKNEMVYYLAREIERKPLFIMHGHEELTPEDIACTARLNVDNRVEYVGSPLLAAMLEGGICFMDEIGKVPARSLSLLASVLDDRRTLTSVLAGFSVRAQPGFRFCAAMNDAEAATCGLPGYIDERLRPAFKLGHPPPDEVMTIVRQNVKGATPLLLDRFRVWVATRQNVSPRLALTLVSYAARLMQMQGAGQRKKWTSASIGQILAEAERAVEEGRLP